MKLPLVILLFGSALAFGQTPPASTLFDKDAVHEIRLTFTQSDWWEQLTTNYQDNEDNVPYISASIVWGEYKFDSVGVRFKGNSSYAGATTKKKPFRIKLNEFVKGQKIDGMASFSVSNAWNDPSFVREKPYYELATAAGLKSPRSNFAALYINDQFWGLYVLTEVVNGDFLKSFFGKGNDTGNLYKANMGTSFSYLGADAAPYKEFLEKQSNEDADDWTDMIQFCKVLNETAIEELPAKLEPLLDIDSVLTALALDNLTVNLDSYVSMGQNFYIYRRPSDNRFVWIPWDPSLAFGALAQGLTVAQMKELPLEYTSATGGGAQGGNVTPGVGGAAVAQAGRPLATRLWEVPQYKQRYRQIYQQMVDKVLIPDTLIARMNALRGMIRPWVAMDTQKLVTMEQFDQAMTTDASSGATPVGTGPGGGFPGGVPPGGAIPGGPGPGGPPPGGDFPGGQLPIGGAAGGGGMSAPGLQPFIAGRVLAVKALLAGQTPLSTTATPTSLAFAAIAGGSAPAAQTVSLKLSDTSKTAAYTAAASATWLTVTPASGSVPSSLSVYLNPSKLSAGSYSGSVTVTTPSTTGGVTIPVTAIVTTSPSLAATPSTVTLIAAAAGGGQPGLPTFPGGATNPAAQTIQVLSTAGATNFTVTTSSTTCSGFFSATPSAGVTPATVTVSVNTAAVGSGSCSGTIAISGTGVASATVAVTLAAISAGLTPTVSAIANSASYAAGAIAPGEIVTIFGSNLGRQNMALGTFANGKLATTLNGIQVTFDGVAAPIVYSRSDQMSVVVPFEVAGKTQSKVQVSNNGQTSTALQLAVGIAAPGIFTTGSSGSGQGAIYDQAGKLAGQSSPAAKGSTVSIYMTGAGQLQPAGVTGAVGSASPLQWATAPVLASIGGQLATVTYSGAVPNSVQGLYQINVVVPASAPSGPAAVLLSVGGAVSQSGVTLTVQ